LFLFQNQHADFTAFSLTIKISGVFIARSSPNIALLHSKILDLKVQFNSDRMADEYYKLIYNS
jgi:hypothetical protein